MKAIFSIKPEYVEKIFSGQKLYEFRKQICKKRVSAMLIYSTWPVCRVVGEAKIIDILMQKKAFLWEKTKENAGISKDFFDSYYDGYEYAIAYVLGEVKKYENPRTLESYGIKAAPQSFCYVEE